MNTIFITIYLFILPPDFTVSSYDTVTDFDSDPAFLLTEPEITQLKKLIREDEAVQYRYDSLLKAANAAAELTPNPPDTLYYEGMVGTNPKRQRTIWHLMDMKRLRALTWAYILSNQPRYLQAAKEYLLDWTETLEASGNPINDNKLVSIIFAHYMLKEELNQREKKQVENWMRRLAEAEIKSEPMHPHGNWHAKRIKLVAFVGSTLQEEKYLDYSSLKFKENVISSLYPDGSSIDFEQRDALHYHVSGLDPMLEIALALRNSRDLYDWETDEGASLKKSLHFVLPYAMGEKTHAEWVNTQVQLDKERWASGDEFYRPGKTWQPLSSLETFQMGSLFDDDLKKVVSHLAPNASLNTWTEVLIAMLMNT